MKKILLTLLAVAVVAGGITIVRAADETISNKREERPLEKIAHPSHVKNFEGIQRIGNALWGRRKNSNNSASRASETSDKRSMNPSNSKETKTEVKQSIKVEPVAAACVKTAIEKKDNNLKTGLNTHNTSMVSAIDARTTCQKAALDLTTAFEQARANATCVKTYHQAVGESLRALKITKETGWKTFREDLKVCKTLQTSDASQGEILIEDGEVQINLEVDSSVSGSTDVK